MGKQKPRVTRSDALYSVMNAAWCGCLWDFLFFFINTSLRRMQNDKDQEIGGVGSDVGNNSPLIRLLVIRQAFVPAIRDVEVTDWPFWRLSSLQTGMLLITHEMKDFREEMTQNTQLFKYLIKESKTNLQNYVSPIFFFLRLIWNLLFSSISFCLFWSVTFVTDFGMFKSDWLVRVLVGNWWYNQRI